MEVEIKFENFLNILSKYIHDKSTIRKILSELNLDISRSLYSLEESTLKRKTEASDVSGKVKSRDPIYERLEKIEKALEADKKAISGLFDRMINLEKMLDKIMMNHDIRHEQQIRRAI